MFFMPVSLKDIIPRPKRLYHDDGREMFPGNVGALPGY
jgi:hypothetical protein